MNAYQKLKEENKQLKVKHSAIKERLFEVCLRPDSDRSKLIIDGVKVAEQIMKKYIKQIVYGNETDDNFDKAHEITINY